jgi:hypothetical protein
MPRPAKLPEWASSGVNVLEPGAGKKVAGWLNGEQPPASYFNWLAQLQYDWTKYIDRELAALDIRAKKQAIARMSTTAIDASFAYSMAIKPDTGRIVTINYSSPNTVIRYGSILGGAWAAATSIAGFFNGVHWDGSLFQLYGASIYWSADGISWTLGGSVSGLWSMATSPGGVRVAVSASQIARSTNGTSWTTAAAPAAFSGAVEPQVVWDATSARFVVPLTNGNTVYSSDGLTWFNGAAHGLTPSGSYLDATYYERLGGVVMIGHNGVTTTLKYSLDGGQSWLASALVLPAPGGAHLFSMGTALGVWTVGAPMTIQMSALLLDATDWSPVQIPSALIRHAAIPERQSLQFLQAPGVGVAGFLMSADPGGLYLSDKLGVAA